MNNDGATGTNDFELANLLERAVAKTPVEGETRVDYVPTADVKVTSSEVVIFLDLPGVDEDDIGIDFQHGRVVVHGTREFDHDQEDAEEFVRLDRPYGQFVFRYQLTPDSDCERARARYKRGVLKIRVPRDHTLSTKGCP